MSLALWPGAITVAANILSVYQLLSAALQGILLQIEEAKLPQRSQVCFADVQKVEMLLETYSLHTYSTYNKLQLLKEYVEDTEVPTSASCKLTKQLALCIHCMLNRF